MEQVLGRDLPGARSGGADVELPCSQVLFSDQGEDSLLPDPIPSTPSKPKRRRGSRKVYYMPAQNITSDSSDYEPPSKKLSLEEIFYNHNNRRLLSNRKARRRSERQKTRLRRLHRSRLPPEKRPKQKCSRKGVPIYTLPPAEREKRMRHRGVNFPFTLRKHLPFTQYFLYEQSLLGGFLNYVKKIKAAKYLKNALNNMGVSEDVEETEFEMRRHGFLDDDEPISPISEAGDEDNENQMEHHDAVIVENGSFILDSHMPSKKEWQTKLSSRKRKVHR